ncbi:glucose-1-phosphate thymidylyltransferase [Arcobacter sp. HD9-500m-PIT-SAG03]|nr:glucose-1-phosphate thymidylyltransferase [Arcobacter sp. HD9-500m-PIT-SAG03]
MYRLLIMNYCYNSEDIDRFKLLLKDGSQLGINLKYEIQHAPEGLAQSFIIGEQFIGNDNVCLILGDNIFYGHDLTVLLQNSINIVEKKNKSVIYGYTVNDPERYGVVEFDNKKNVLSIEEKPKKPKSNFAIVGLYFFTNDVIEIAKRVNPSDRGELEITSIIQEYFQKEKLKIEILGRGIAWLDTGTHESLLEASQFIETIEKRQGLKVACIEEIAYIMGYISKKQLEKLAEPLKKTSYGKYLLELATKDDNA